MALVQASLNALGGEAQIAQIAQIADCTIKAQVEPAPNSGRESGTIVYTVSGQQYRSDLSVAGATQTIASGNGQPFITTPAKSERFAPHQFRAMFAPPSAAMVLLRELRDPKYSLIYKGTGTIGTEAVSIVATSSQANRIDSLVTPQRWYFDSASGLPIRIDYRMPDSKSPSHAAPGSVDLSEYKNVSGVLFPFRFVSQINGIPMTITSVTSVETNTGVPSSTFQSPLGGAQ